MVKDFNRPQFVCPIRTLKGRGSNYTTDDIDTTYCPTNSYFYINDDKLAFNPNPVYGPHEQWELDPDNKNCSTAVRKSSFATCKNTCPGGETIFNLVNISRPSFIF